MIDLIHEIGKLFAKVGLESDVVLKDDTRSKLPIDDLSGLRTSKYIGFQK